MKLPYDIEVNNHLFTIYHLHYKEKLLSNPTKIYVCATNYLYFLCGLNNLSISFFFAQNSIVCITEPHLVTKKREPLRTSLYLFSHVL